MSTYIYFSGICFETARGGGGWQSAGGFYFYRHYSFLYGRIKSQGDRGEPFVVSGEGGIGCIKKIRQRYRPLVLNKIVRILFDYD